MPTAPTRPTDSTAGRAPGRWRLLLSAGVAIAALALATLAVPASVAAQGQGDPGHGTPYPHMPHVFVIMMENASLGQIMAAGNPNTTYIRHLAHAYGLADQYYGVTHTSLPNYMAATSGSTWGSNNDDVAQAPYFNHVNLVDQLEAHGISWKAYMESLPYPGFSGAYSRNGLYAKKHDPFMLYPDIYQNRARARHVVPLRQLKADLASNHVPAYSWISPNLCNDMHGGVYSGSTTCPYASSKTVPGPDAQLESDGNAFLKKWVPAIMDSPAWTQNSTIFITWDEGSYYNYYPWNPVSSAGCCDSPIIPKPQFDTSNTSGGDLSTGTVYGGGRVPMIVIAREGARHYQNTQPYNHYSLLRTIEANFGLGYLQDAGDSQQVHSLRAFLMPRHS